MSEFNNNFRNESKENSNSNDDLEKVEMKMGNVSMMEAYETLSKNSEIFEDGPKFGKHPNRDKVVECLIKIYVAGLSMYMEKLNISEDDGHLTTIQLFELHTSSFSQLLKEFDIQMCNLVQSQIESNLILSVCLMKFKIK